MRVLLLASLAACSFPEKHLATGDANGSGGKDARSDGTMPVDALAGFECRGHPLPTTAPQTLVVSGLIYDTGGANPVPGASVHVIEANGNSLGSATTSQSGAYSITIPTGNAPVDAHINASAPMFISTTAYPSAPLAADYDASFGLLTSSAAQSVANAAGTNYNAQDAMIVAYIYDCDHNTQAGAVLQNPQPAAVVERYVAGGALSATATSTDSSGNVYLVNVPPPQVTLNATLSDGMAQLPRAITANGGEFIYAALQPAP